MKKILPIIITVVLICVVVVLLVIRGPQSPPEKGTDPEAVGTGGSAVTDTDLQEIEIGEEFTVELEENQAVGGF